MKWPEFSAWVDGPLGLVVAMAAVIHCRRWAASAKRECNVDLMARLPRAQLSVVAVVVGILVLCWWANIALWALGLAGLGVGLIAGVLLVGASDVPLFVYAPILFFIREWAFGFPLLVLHPVTESNLETKSSKQLGVRGKVVAPLRPLGTAELNGEIVQVEAEGGVYVDSGVDVVVCGWGNGVVRVRVVEA